jgi:hypothetical protein
MAESVEWLDRVHNGRSAIISNSYQLRELARAFARTGNDLVAEELVDIADRNELAAKDMVNAVGEDLNRQVQAGQNLMGDLVVAALDTLGTRKHDESI